MVRMIVTDLDNTLLSSKKEVTDYSYHVLSLCNDKNIKIVFATARPERATLRFQKKITPDFIISNNGATISHNRKIIYNNFIENNIVNDVISAFLRIPQITTLTVEAGNCLYTNYVGPPWEEGWNPKFTDFSNCNFSNIAKISTECKQTSIVTDVLSRFSDLNLFANTDEIWQQITKKDSLKINAIKYIVSNCLFCEMSDVIAFGDDYNDIEMIKECGIGVAMGNAINEVRSVADYICETNDNDGVGKWLSKYIL